MSRDDARRAADILEAINAIAFAVDVMNSHDTGTHVRQPARPIAPQCVPSATAHNRVIALLAVRSR